MSFIVLAIRSISELSGDIAIVPVFESRKLSGNLLTQIDKGTNGSVRLLLANGEFTGKAGELLALYKPALPVNVVLLVGLGAQPLCTPEQFRKSLGLASRHKAVQHAQQRSLVVIDEMTAADLQAAIEGFMLGGYRYTAYKKATSKTTSVPSLHCYRFGKSVAGMQAAVDRAVICADGQMLARELKETPPNDLTPTRYADRIKQLGKKYSLTVTVLDEPAIRKERMGGVLAVSQGSAQPPRFAIVAYRGAAASVRPIVLVGKGVTFDTGGISIKPAADMHEMKQDMAGSAAVLGAVVTASKLKLKQNVVALMPIVENMPSGSAFRPGDILTMRSGKTVEITNTDAEGRLILADALDYARRFNPQAVIDIATLTGAARFILGLAGAPIMGNNAPLMDKLRAASAKCGERVWELPIWPDYHEQMKSPVADLVNSGPPVAGTLAAAAFLEEFVGDWPWAHIDIAYVDLEKSDKPYTPKGATGFGVRLLVELIANWKRMN